MDIAVIRLPRISNFTDFSPFERYENVSLRYVGSVRELHQPDLILLPGTKSTIADLLWLRQSGLEAAVQKAAAAGTLVFGVCGGYQMLGRTVSDPEGVEAAGVTQAAGLGLLPVDTVFRGEKKQTQARGVFGPVEGLARPPERHGLRGYEIHMAAAQRNARPSWWGAETSTAATSTVFSTPPASRMRCWASCARARAPTRPDWAASTRGLTGSSNMTGWPTECAADWIWTLCTVCSTAARSEPADGGNAKRCPGRAAVFYGRDQASIWRPRNPAMVCTSL